MNDASETGPAAANRCGPTGVRASNSCRPDVQHSELATGVAG